jgi:hypothetical protein
MATAGVLIAFGMFTAGFDSLDITPRQFIRIAREKLPVRY